MQQIVGYKLTRISDGATVQSWGGTWGLCPGVPNPVRLPTGDDVHAPSLDTVMDGYVLNAWRMDAPPATEADYGAAVQQAIDGAARARGYLDGVTCASYAASGNAAWKNDATAFLTWRDAVWEFVYQTLAQVKAGAVSQPSVDQLVADLPAMKWA